MDHKCKKCGSKNLFTEKIVDATGLYCRECGAFQKHLREDELHVFKHTQSVNSNLSSTKSSPKMPPANPPRSNFRRCKGTYYNKKTYKTESFNLGYFMGWGIDYDEFTNIGTGHYTAAIIELPNGKIILTEAYNITFIDKVENLMKV